MDPAIVVGSAGMGGQRRKKLPRTTSHMMARIATPIQVQIRWVSQVWVMRIGTLFSRIGMNSDRVAVQATTMRDPWRRRIALQMPVKAWMGGDSRIERSACCGLSESR